MWTALLRVHHIGNHQTGENKEHGDRVRADRPRVKPVPTILLKGGMIQHNGQRRAHSHKIEIERKSSAEPGALCYDHNTHLRGPLWSLWRRSLWLGYRLAERCFRLDHG